MKSFRVRSSVMLYCHLGYLCLSVCASVCASVCVLEHSHYAAVMCFVYLIYLIVDLVDFSDEEGYGKYLDLHSLHREFINIKGLEVWDSLTLQCSCVVIKMLIEIGLSDIPC